MEKIELEYLLEALSYGLNDCTAIDGNTETHYNQFANAIDVIKGELNLLTIPVVSKCGCGGVMEETIDGLNCTICG